MHGAGTGAVGQGSCLFAPLHEAARHGHAELVRLLLERGARVNARSGTGRTALHLAAEEGHADVVRVLVDSGADVSIRDGRGKTAADRARREGEGACAELLR